MRPRFITPEYTADAKSLNSFNYLETYWHQPSSTGADQRNSAHSARQHSSRASAAAIF